LSHTGHIAHDHTKPGQGISADGLEAGTPGQVFSTKGSPSKQRYKYVSFWIDHATRFVYTTFHSLKAAEELVTSKAEFESWASQHNVRIQSIRADNGVYSANLFKEACKKQQQQLTFCAVGAHWQNRIAERFIGVITERARSVLLHAMAKWPDLIKEEFWPFAIRYAVLFHNASIRKNQSQSPYHLFTGQEAPWAISNFHIFGSPCFVLHKELQDGNNFNKWRSRAWGGIYIGPSTCHSSNVPLIYNPDTTHVSPQFHVLHDDHFAMATGNPHQMDTILDQLETTAQWLHKDPYTDNPYTFPAYWDDRPESQSTNPKPSACKRPRVDETPTPPSPNDAAPRGSSPSIANNVGSRGSPSSPQMYNIEDVPESLRPQAMAHSFQHPATPTLSIPAAPLPYLFRSQYQAKPLTGTCISQKRLKQIDGTVYILVSTTNFPVPSMPPSRDSSLPIHFAFTALDAFTDGPNEIPAIHPHTFPAVDLKVDTLTHSQMLRVPDASQFIQAQVLELNGLQDMGVFDVKPMITLQPNARLLSSIWSYRRKRSPIGTILNHKAHYVLMALNRSLAMIIGRPTHLSSRGQPCV